MTEVQDNQADSDRRNSDRALIHAVVGIDSSDRSDRVGVTRNLSSKGALFHSASKFSPGEKLSLRLRAPGDNSDRHIDARVVRVELEDPMSASLFLPPHGRRSSTCRSLTSQSEFGRSSVARHG